MDTNFTMPLATTCHDEVHWTRQGVSGLAASGNKASIEKLRLTFDASEVSAFSSFLLWGQVAVFTRFERAHYVRLNGCSCLLCQAFGLHLASSRAHNKTQR